MPTSCCAIGCTNHTYKKECIDRKVSFHKFPKDPVLRKAWLFEMRRQDYNPARTTTICSDHFEPDCFTFQKNTNRRCLVNDALPTIFSFSKKKSSIIRRATPSGPKDLSGPLPGREPRGQAKAPTFKDFLLSRNQKASEAQSKLNETNKKLAVLHRRRLMLNNEDKFKTIDRSGSSSLLYPPYESYFVNYTGESKSEKVIQRKSSVKLLSADEGSFSDDKSSNSSENFASDGSSCSFQHQPSEEMSSSDESMVDDPSPTNAFLKGQESEIASEEHEAKLSSNQTSNDNSTAILSPEKSEDATENAQFKNLLEQVDATPSEKDEKIALTKSYVKTYSKHKNSFSPRILEKEGSSIGKDPTSDPALKYYIESLSTAKNTETSDALVSVGETPKYNSMNSRHARARRAAKLIKKLENLRRATESWKQKNANLKNLLDQQGNEQDSE